MWQAFSCQITLAGVTLAVLAAPLGSFFRLSRALALALALELELELEFGLGLELDL